MAGNQEKDYETMKCCENRNETGRKIAIVGAGFVGSSIAFALSVRSLADQLVLIDVEQKKVQAEVDDLQHGIPLHGRASVVVGDYADCADSDLIVITAGRNRRPGESRLQLIDDNKVIMKHVIDQVKRYYTRGIILVVANPVDIMVHLCSRWMGLPEGKVFGTGCGLDSARLVYEISNYIGCAPEKVSGYVAGEHGDSQFPVWSKVTVDGVSLDTYCSNAGVDWGDEQKTRIAERVKKMGASIIEGKGRTHYGIALVVCSIAEGLFGIKPPVAASVSAPLRGEYGVSGVSLSIPSLVGPDGVKERLVEHWTEEEIALFRAAAEKVKPFLGDMNE